MHRIIENRKKNWEELYEGKRNFAYMVSPKVGLGDVVGKRPRAWFFEKKYIDATLEWSKRYYDEQVNLIEKLDDDRIPYLYIPTGTEIFGQSFGCKVKYPNDNMPFALPLIHDLKDVGKLKNTDIGDEPLSTILNMMDRLYDWAGDDAVTKLIDVQTPMDIMALLVEKTAYYIAMLDDPDILFNLVSQIKKVMFDFFDEWFNRYGNEYIAHFPDYFMKGGLSVSEDEIGAVSVELFEKYFLGELDEISEHFGGIGIHCCADSAHQWDNFAKVKNLKLLNLHQPNEIITKAYEHFENITVQFHNAQGTGDIDKWYTAKPKNARCVYNIEVNDIEEGKKVIENIQKTLRWM